MSEIFSRVPSLTEGVASRLVEGLAVAVTPADNTLHTFENSVATEIWSLIDGRKSVSEIVDGVVEQFDVDRGQAERDVVEFVELLKQRGLVQLSP